MDTLLVRKNLIDWLKVRSRPFLFSTALPPGDVAAITAAVQMIIDSTELHDKLWENGDYLKAGLEELGFNIGHLKLQLLHVLLETKN